MIYFLESSPVKTIVNPSGIISKEILSFASEKFVELIEIVGARVLFVDFWIKIISKISTM